MNLKMKPNVLWGFFFPPASSGSASEPKLPIIYGAELSYTSTPELNAIKYVYAAQEQGDFSVSCLAVY